VGLLVDGLFLLMPLLMLRLLWLWVGVELVFFRRRRVSLVGTRGRAGLSAGLARIEFVDIQSG
jgi:hypothetical protein